MGKRDRKTSLKMFLEGSVQIWDKQKEEQRVDKDPQATSLNPETNIRAMGKVQIQGCHTWGRKYLEAAYNISK